MHAANFRRSLYLYFGTDPIATAGGVLALTYPKTYFFQHVARRWEVDRIAEELPRRATKGRSSVHMALEIHLHP